MMTSSPSVLYIVRVAVAQVVESAFSALFSELHDDIQWVIHGQRYSSDIVWHIGIDTCLSSLAIELFRMEFAPTCARHPSHDMYI